MHDESTLPCNCARSPFIDEHHKHVITGDLRIVTNNKLRKLFVKGPKYREPVTINFEEARKEIIDGLEIVVGRWVSSTGVDDIVFEDWRQEFGALLDKRVAELTKPSKCHIKVPILKQQQPKQSLMDLHRNYVITPIDKASGNIAIICQRFYAQVLVAELGIKNRRDNCDVTYEEVKGIDKDILIKQHKDDLKSKFNIALGEDNESLPNMYWLPKNIKYHQKKGS